MKNPSARIENEYGVKEKYRQRLDNLKKIRTSGIKKNISAVSHEKIRCAVPHRIIMHQHNYILLNVALYVLLVYRVPLRRSTRHVAACWGFFLL